MSRKSRDRAQGKAYKTVGGEKPTADDGGTDDGGNGGGGPLVEPLKAKPTASDAVEVENVHERQTGQENKHDSVTIGMTDGEKAYSKVRRDEDEERLKKAYADKKRKQQSQLNQALSFSNRVHSLANIPPVSQSPQNANPGLEPLYDTGSIAEKAEDVKTASCDSEYQGGLG